MRIFNYQALSKDEELLTGQIAAASAAAALAELESEGLTVLLIRQSDTQEAVPPKPAPKTKLVSEGTGNDLLRQKLEQVLDQRAILAPALGAFAEELPAGSAKRDLERFAKRLQDGATADDLLHSTELISVWLPLVGSDTPLDSGHLQEVFAQAEREYANRALVKRTLAYPAIVFALAMVVLVLLGVWIVPTFEEIFWDFDMQLPSITEILLDFSQLVRFKPLLFVLGAVAAYGVFVLSLRLFKRWILPSRAFGKLLDGNTQQVSEMALFVQHLRESLSTGLSISDALKLVGRITNHRWLKREAARLSGALAGDPNQASVLANSALPSTVAFALQAGPQSDPNVHLLGAIADNYFERVRHRFQWSTGFLPQFALLVVGFIVGCVVLGLFLPLVTLINGLTYTGPAPPRPGVAQTINDPYLFLLVLSLALLAAIWLVVRLRAYPTWKSTPWWPADTLGTKQRSLLRLLMVAAEERLEAAPLVACLAEEHRGRHRRRLRRLGRRMAAGTSLADALEQTPGVLSDDQALAIRFGDQSGTLPATLQNLLETRAISESRIASRIRQVIFYIAVTAMVFTLILSFLMIKIVPSYQAIFDDFELNLPRPMVVLIRVCTIAEKYWWLGALVIIALLLAVRSERVKRFLRRSIQSRIVKPIAQLRSANLLGLLATSIRSGRPVAGALSTLARYHFDPKIRHKLLFVRNEVEQGADVWNSMATARLLTPAEANALAKSTSSETRAWTINQLSELRRGQVERRIDMYVSMVQPLVTLLLGAIVLFVAVACLSPLLDLVMGLSG